MIRKSFADSPLVILALLLTAFGIDIPGIKHIFFGFVLLLVVLALPEGMWPWISRRLGLSERGR